MVVLVNGKDMKEERKEPVGEIRGDEKRRRESMEALTMDLFGGEAPKLLDYSITRRGQADGGSRRRGRREDARLFGLGEGGSRGAPVVKPTLRDVGDAPSIGRLRGSSNRRSRGRSSFEGGNLR